MPKSDHFLNVISGGILMTAAGVVLYLALVFVGRAVFHTQIGPALSLWPDAAPARAATKHLVGPPTLVRTQKGHPVAVPLINLPQQPGDPSVFPPPLLPLYPKPPPSPSPSPSPSRTHSGSPSPTPTTPSPTPTTPSPTPTPTTPSPTPTPTPTTPSPTPTPTFPSPTPTPTPTTPSPSPSPTTAAPSPTP